jgi:hypothetical protein
LARKSAFLLNGVGASDRSARVETMASLVLAREYKHHAAFSNRLIAVRCLFDGKGQNSYRDCE